MQYKALYRKYRPLDFKDVLGQDPIIKTLINSIKNNKIGHAYLFTGTRGTGKTSVAKMFAKTINCEKLVNGQPCNECSICKTNNYEELTDIIEIDAASNNGVDEIREIKNKASLVPVLCKYKVYIIDEVHMLSIGAFNALLKTLEEPPSHAIFILATTEPQKIPMTIISRCQRFDFKKISIIDIQNRLKFISKKEKININEECIEEISKLSDGSLRDAIGLLDQMNSFSEDELTISKLYDLTGNIEVKTIFNIINNIFENNINQLIETYDILYNKGKDFQRISQSILDILLNIMIYKNAKQYFEKKDIKYKNEIIISDKKVSTERLYSLIEELNDLLDNIKKSSNPNILFELFLLKTIDLKLIKTIDEEDKNIEKKIIETSEIAKKKEDKVDIEKTKPNIDNKNYEFNPKYKEALINNTIALANSESKKEIKKAFQSLDKYLLQPKYKTIASTLMDSNINAASNDHLLLTYKYDSMVQEHDKNNKRIEKLINEIISRKYKIVAISEERWKEIRPKYIDLKDRNQKIELMEEIEDESIACSIEKNTEYDEIINEFGNEIIEMEE